MKIALPYPVSANRYWRSFAYRAKGTGKPRAVTVVSDEAKAYKREAGWRAKLAGCRTPLAGALELRITLVPKNRVCMDLDNALKVTLDALKGIAYADDDQVWKITACRAEPDGDDARLEVEILPLQLPMALEAHAA